MFVQPAPVPSHDIPTPSWPLIFVILDVPVLNSFFSVSGYFHVFSPISSTLLRTLFFLVSLEQVLGDPDSFFSGALHILILLWRLN